MRRALLLVPLAAAAVAAGVALHRHSGGSPAATATPPSRAPVPVASRAAAPPRLGERAAGDLRAPVQDAAVAAAGTGVLLLGGLTATDQSTADVVAAAPGRVRTLGRLPSPRHDAAAAALGGAVYVFGGGDGVRQLDEIVRVDPRSGRAVVVGRLPAPSSDSAAAAVGGTAYVVGGYTGSAWLDTIVSWRPGSPARVVARLPQPVRYAAVAAAAGRVLVAGGSLQDGRASAAVYAFTPATGRVVRLARLPRPTTHAAAAAVGRVVYVIGGRGALQGTQTGAVVAVDARTGRVRGAGRLRAPRSDLAAAAVAGRILLAGGRGPGGTTATVAVLAPRAARAERAQRVDVYAADGPGMLAPAARAARPLVYVPNSQSDTVDEIDPRTFRVVRHFAVGALPQHVVPSWDLRTLYVTNDVGNSLTAVDPRTGRPGRTIPVDDPYNMYFTPDGRWAIVVAERLRRLDFRDAHSFRLHRSVTVPCAGVDHMDFSADGRFLLASCEFSGQLVEVDVRRERVVRTIDLPGRAIPQDVKLSPDGRLFYVADLRAGGLWEVEARRLRVAGFLRTGAGVHGLYPSRDARYLYATNRSAGSISVVSFRTRRVVATWPIPGGGSPDMGGVSADGRVLWLSGRYNGVVYAISTRDGSLLARVRVGLGPHGVCVWPQPGRYSLGHTGILR